MRALSGRDELDLLHRNRVDHRHAHAALVGHVENRAVGRQLHVDGEAAHGHVAGKLHLVHVDFRHDARILGGDHEVATVGAEIEVIGAGPRDSHRLQELPTVAPVSKLHALLALHHVDRLRAVRGEVQVVGIGNRNRARRLAGVDVDDRQAARPLVVHVQRAHIPRRRDVVRNPANPEVVDDLIGVGVDDIDGSGPAVGDVNALRNLAQRAWDRPGEVVGIDVEHGIGQARRLDIGRCQQARGLGVRRRWVFGDCHGWGGPYNCADHDGRADDDHDEYRSEENPNGAGVQDPSRRC